MILVSNGTQLNNVVPGVGDEYVTHEELEQAITTLTNSFNEQITNLNNEISKLQDTITSQSTEINQLKSQLDLKLPIAGGTMTGNLVAAPMEDEADNTTAQVHNMVTYPAGTKVEDIEIPPAGTLVVILDPEVGDN